MLNALFGNNATIKMMPLLRRIEPALICCSINNSIVHSQNLILVSFQIERNAIGVTVFPLIVIQMEFYLVPNRKETCHHDHIPFNLKLNWNKVMWMGEIRLGTSTTIRHTAVREAGASRYHVAAQPPETPWISRHYATEGFNGALNCTLILFYF